MAKAEVLYADNHLLVLNKPAGILTQATQQESCSLEELGKQWIKENYHKPGDVFLGALHRLDRPVSGIVLLARTSKALTRLNEKQRAGCFHKEYTAIVEGSWKEDEGELQHYLQRSSYMTKAYLNMREGAKRSHLKYKVIQRMKGRTCLSIHLLTGRYHQIRAQLAATGYPIVGDVKYGSTTKSELLLLHHTHFSFPHPITGEVIEIYSPVPLQWGFSLNK